MPRSPSPSGALSPLQASRQSPTSHAERDSVQGPELSPRSKHIGADLRAAQLSGRDLRGVDLSRADLTGAALDGANLGGATLFETRLDRADLTGADLTGANLEGVSARHAGFGGAKLVDCQLIKAELEGATLSLADVSGADLRAASLRGVRAHETRWERADLTSVDLSGADLTGGLVTRAIFDRADLSGAKLARLKEFRNAGWIGVHVRETDFDGAHLLRRHILDANYLAEFRGQSRSAALVYHLWSLSSDCGRSMLRWSACTGLLAVVYALAFAQVELAASAPQTWLTPLYFSIVTLTTLGYGDVTPVSTAGQLLAASQVILGYMMLGGLISIFQNKMARRAE